MRLAWVRGVPLTGEALSFGDLVTGQLLVAIKKTRQEREETLTNAAFGSSNQKPATKRGWRAPQRTAWP